MVRYIDSEKLMALEKMAKRVSFIAKKKGAKRGTRVTFYSTRKKKS